MVVFVDGCVGETIGSVVIVFDLGVAFDFDEPDVVGVVVVWAGGAACFVVGAGGFVV